MTKWVGSRAISGELYCGIWLNLGVSLSAEMAGMAGFDWVCIDLEHGAGDYTDLLGQLHALSGSKTVPIVRISSNDAPQFKRVLDLGPSGVMVPFVNSVREAQQAVSYMRYPPQGIRGVARMNRAASFGSDFNRYFSEANKNLLLAIQIETTEALEAAPQIAEVEGVQVLFVGPLDLSVSLGIPQQFDHPTFQSALKSIVLACRKAGKTPGILCPTPDDIPALIEMGFTFIAASSDGSLIQSGMQRLMASFKLHRD